MSKFDGLIQIGFDKNGEVDYRISGEMGSLTLEQMNELRRMIPVAIWQAEEWWKLYSDHWDGLQAHQAITPLEDRGHE